MNEKLIPGFLQGVLPQAEWREITRVAVNNDTVSRLAGAAREYLAQQSLSPELRAALADATDEVVIPIATTTAMSSGRDWPWYDALGGQQQTR